ncbi:hypothetical protein N431DRAFT_462459 [Stipitochalara longipes BDJ]|nr:hypothetical protein N431DRAFT_462459 [Stipitochalara longipes BDJ]
MASLTLSKLALDNGPAATSMTKFLDFPTEIQEMILREAVDCDEIIKINTVRQIKRNKTKSCKTISDRIVPAGFTSYYEANSVLVKTDRSEVTREDGLQYQRSGLAFANPATRKVYLSLKPAYIRHNKNGVKMFFNPASDKLYFTDLTRFTLHYRRQRLRHPVPYLHGCEAIRTIIFDEKTDEKRVKKLIPDTVAVFMSAVKQIERQVNFAKEKTQDWGAEVQEEHYKYLLEVEKADWCLDFDPKLAKKVNGTKMAPGVKILRFPDMAEEA